uniref:Uncharacterized protein n=1 Tax=Anguilla anguilla TaxID=7936 RepID=A0A0E9UHX8_ANGAN
MVQLLIPDVGPRFCLLCEYSRQSCMRTLGVTRLPGTYRKTQPVNAGRPGRI